MSGDQNNAKIGSAIASVAAATVNGYLLNAVKRQRVPKAEGGRGTRRRIDMVTSAAIPSSAAFDGVVDVNDWDEVELPTCVQVKKVESCGVKDEQMEVPIEANPPVTKVEVVGEQGTVNNQEMKVDGAHAKSKLLANDAPEPSHAEVMDIDGASPPLAQGGWRPTDPCYTSMVEQRDLLAAQRRSERMQVICESTTEMLVMLNRGRTVWRESRHPALLKLLLRIDRGEYDSHPTTSTGEDSSTFLSTSGSGPCRSVIQAVKFASKCFRESQEASEKRLTLAPCWITPTKDAVKNRTSEGVTALLHTLNSVFSLSVASTEEGAPTVYRWNTVLEPQFLVGTLKEAVLHPPQSSIALPNSIYFCVLFISLATAAGFSCRLMVARDDGRKKGTEEAPEGGERPSDVPLEKMSIFLPRKKAKTAAPKKGSREAESIHSKRMPTSCYWVEVWSEERESFLSVNPCAGCTTMWGAPYTFSISGDTVVDATPRYTSKMSSSYGFGRRLGSCKELRLLWKNQISWDDPREISDIVTSKFCSSKRSALGQRQQTRETKQLESLRFSETVPNTLGSLQKHPLFVIESYLARHEAVYPKDATTIVGSVKGNTVYKRSAVVVLRSRDGWLREGRGLTSDEVPYKTVSPPASRPFASPSQLFGHWQTKPFEPLPLLEDGSIPTHGRTHWYILLDKLCPPSVSHMKEPQIIKVARRMRLDFRLAVTGFLRRQPQENRRGHWEAVIEGIVVRTSDRSALLHAYSDWIQLVQEQEAARRKDRAYRWWLFLAQRLLAMERLEAQYMRGVALGGLPKY